MFSTLPVATPDSWGIRLTLYCRLPTIQRPNMAFPSDRMITVSKTPFNSTFTGFVTEGSSGVKLNSTIHCNSFCLSFTVQRLLDSALNHWMVRIWGSGNFRLLNVKYREAIQELIIDKTRESSAVCILKGQSRMRPSAKLLVYSKHLFSNCQSLDCISILDRKMINVQLRRNSIFASLQSGSSVQYYKQPFSLLSTGKYNVRCRKLIRAVVSEVSSCRKT